MDRPHRVRQGVELAAPIINMSPGIDPREAFNCRGTRANTGRVERRNARGGRPNLKDNISINARPDAVLNRRIVLLPAQEGEASLS